MARSEDLAWAAGFFDGEGCFTSTSGPYICKNGTRIQRRYLRAQVSQKDPALLWRFRAIFETGNIHGWKDTPTHSGGHNFCCNGKQALRVAAEIWPWLGERKKADFKRTLLAILNSRRAAVLLERQTRLDKTCAADDCATRFVTSNRHPTQEFCSKRCYQRVYKRALRAQTQGG